LDKILDETILQIPFALVVTMMLLQMQLGKSRSMKSEIVSLSIILLSKFLSMSLRYLAIHSSENIHVVAQY
jgi:hypothetical protein